MPMKHHSKLRFRVCQRTLKMTKKKHHVFLETYHLESVKNVHAAIKASVAHAIQRKKMVDVLGKRCP